MVGPMSAISIASSGITITTSPDYLLDSLTAGYVLLTFALAIIAFRSLRQTQASLDLTRQQIKLNKQQSQAAIEAVNRQITASERQTQETLFNQNKPVIILHSPTADSASAKRLRSANEMLTIDLDIENVGTGIASNIWSVASYPKSSLEADKQYTCNFRQVLVPHQKEDVSYYPRLYTFKTDEIEGYSFYPPDSAISQLEIYWYRVVTTYYDIFNRKHLCIFDRTTGNRWEQVVFLSDIKESLDDWTIK